MQRRFAAGLLAGLLFCSGALADGAIRVVNAWTRATVPGQKVAGAYFEISVPMDGRLVGASSAVARAGEIHTMKMDKGVMRMRRIAALDLPAGKPVKLEPGGVHVMLLDLERRLKPGEKIPLTLVVELPNNIRREVTVDMAVLNTAGEGGGHEHH